MSKFKFWPVTIIMSMLVATLSSLAAASNDNFIAGKDYQLVSSPVTVNHATAQKIPVIEFFSYGCPACYQFDPYLTKWLKTKPGKVSFERIPVLFHEGWQPLSQAYYTAKNMGILDKVHQQIFIAIHQQQQDLSDVKTVAALLSKYGHVNMEDVINYWQFSPAISTELSRADAAAQAYQIHQIPSLAIAGKYLLDPSMSDGNLPRMLETLNYLITKVRREQLQNS